MEIVVEFHRFWFKWSEDPKWFSRLTPNQLGAANTEFPAFAVNRVGWAAFVPNRAAGTPRFWPFETCNPDRQAFEYEAAQGPGPPHLASHLTIACYTANAAFGISSSLVANHCRSSFKPIFGKSNLRRIE